MLCALPEAASFLQLRLEHSLHGSIVFVGEFERRRGFKDALPVRVGVVGVFGVVKGGRRRAVAVGDEANGGGKEGPEARGEGFEGGNAEIGERSGKVGKVGVGEGDGGGGGDGHDVEGVERRRETMETRGRMDPIGWCRYSERQ